MNNKILIIGLIVFVMSVFSLNKIVVPRAFGYGETVSAASTTTAITSTVCTDSKPGSAPSLQFATSGDNSITLTWTKADSPVTNYLVAYAVTSDAMQYGNPNVGGSDTTFYTIRGLSGGTTYYFKVKAINGCMPGDFSNVLSATTTGAATAAATPAEGFVPASSIPGQLFDITFSLDQNTVPDINKLKARVTFTSFGTEDTPVQMTFIIVDESGREYYRSVENMTIQTEGIFEKSFTGLTLANGEYNVVLDTLYNSTVYDEFKQPFSIKSTTKGLLGVFERLGVTTFFETVHKVLQNWITQFTSSISRFFSRLK